MEFKNPAKSVIHDAGDGIGYYSIPFLQGEGYVVDKPMKCTAWLDHEWTMNLEDIRLHDWDWVGVHLDCGIAIMAGLSKKFKACDVSMNGTTIYTDFILEGKHLFLHKTGQYLLLREMGEENIFDPKFGMDYSEQPFEVISKGGVIGYGMRERAYRSAK